jgi:hypothetical protein
MFHKQNIPESGPSKDALNNNDQETNNKEENTMSDNTSDTQNNAAPFARPAINTQNTAYGTAQTATTSDGRKLTIGQGITMSGEIENWNG